MSTKTEKKARKASKAVTKAVTPTVPQIVEPAAPKSIRQTIRQGILGGMSTKDLTVVVQANFPGSQAAAKPAKHIAHYRCLLKKEGKTAAQVAAE